MSIKVESNLAEVTKRLQGMQKQIPFALSLAVNRTAQAVKAGLRDEMARVFDRPTPFTLYALQLTPGNKAMPEATVWIKDAARYGERHYLLPQVMGGSRDMKRSERHLGSYWVPGLGTRGGANVGSLQDKYGNLRPGLVTEILAYTGTHPDLHSRLSDASLKRNKRWRKYAYFIEWKDGKPVGVMMRIGKGDPRTVLHFIKSPTYKQRFDFYGVGHRIARQAGPKALADAVQQAIKTANWSQQFSMAA